jgi:hypothetical protein
MITIAAMAVAMTLGGAVVPADAGKKGKRAHQGGSSGKVHIDSKVSSKNLKALQRQLESHGKLTKGQHHVKRAVDSELSNRRAADDAARMILNSGDPITGLLDVGTAIKRKRGH